MSQVLGMERFVVFPLGAQRFALPSGDVVELSRAGVVQKFPHKTPSLMGVLVRRGDVLPVWDLTRALLGPVKVPQKLWLIVLHNFKGEERTAIPVSGECQMVHAEMLPAADGTLPHVLGVLSVENQLIEVIDLSALAVSSVLTTSRIGIGHKRNEGLQ